MPTESERTESVRRGQPRTGRNHAPAAPWSKTSCEQLLIGVDMPWEHADFDVELRNQLVPQIAASLCEAVPGATHAHIRVNDAETNAPYLYAGIILNAEGKRIEMEDPKALENQVINALVDAKTMTSWDGYRLSWT